MNVVLFIGGGKVPPRDQTKELEQFRRYKRLQEVNGDGNACPISGPMRHARVVPSPHVLKHNCLAIPFRFEKCTMVRSSSAYWCCSILREWAGYHLSSKITLLLHSGGLTAP